MTIRCKKSAVLLETIENLVAWRRELTYNGV